MTITADALDMLAGDPPRTRKPGDFHRHPTTGAPYVNHPTETTKDGSPKRVMYGRPSSFGTALDNPYNLVKWKERQLLIGLDALVYEAEYNLWPSPLPVDPDDRDELDQLAARCHEAAGSHLAADQGTHVHLLCELADRDPDRVFVHDEQVILDGVELGIPAQLQMRILTQWFDFRSRLDVSAVGIEQTVVNDRCRLAGTLDRLDVPNADILTSFGILNAGEAFVGDIKTGGLTLGNDGQPNYWIKYPVQLAAYVFGQPYDVDTDERGEWELQPNPDVALIYHYDLAAALNGEPVDWQAIPVNLEAGWEGAELCRAAADFAKRFTLFAMPAPTKPVDETVYSGTPIETEITYTANLAAPVTASNGEQQAVEPEPLAAQAVAGSAADPDRLRARIKELIDAGHEWELRQLWPEGVPPLSKEGHTDEQLGEILWAVRATERHIGAGWHPDDGAQPQPQLDLPLIPDEPVAQADIDALNAAYDALDEQGRTLCAQIAGEAHAAGRSISVSADPTVRRWSIARAVIAWAASGRTVDELWMRAAMLATFDQCADADATLGGLISQFSIEQADRLHEAAEVVT